MIEKYNFFYNFRGMTPLDLKNMADGEVKAINGRFEVT
jgi:hypothetical protein